MIDATSTEAADEYVQTVLKLYWQLPETPLKANASDRQTARRFRARGIELATVETALLLGSLRRLSRAPDVPPLSPIRSLAYFQPVIEEILSNPVSSDYLKYLQEKMQSLCSRGKIDHRR